MWEWAAPEYSITDIEVYALFETLLKFGNRNWRRLKREQNKAVRKARKSKTSIQVEG